MKLLFPDVAVEDFDFSAEAWDLQSKQGNFTNDWSSDYSKIKTGECERIFWTQITLSKNIARGRKQSEKSVSSSCFT